MAFSDKKIISKYLRKDKNLTNAEYRVLEAYFSHNLGKFVPSQNKISEETAIARPNVVRIFKDLREKRVLMLENPLKSYGIDNKYVFTSEYYENVLDYIDEFKEKYDNKIRDNDGLTNKIKIVKKT